jgi:hypothetical protein
VASDAFGLENRLARRAALTSRRGLGTEQRTD